MRTSKPSIIKLHRWLGVLFVLPLLWISGTGLLLQTRNWNSWLQPQALRGEFDIPSLELDKWLRQATAVEPSHFGSWKDVTEMRVIPARKVVLFRSKSNWEVQLDWSDGRPLVSGPRRASFWVKAHEGTLGGEWLRWLVFVPAGLSLVALGFTGIWLAGRRFWRKRKNNERVDSRDFHVRVGTGVSIGGRSDLAPPVAHRS